jgi:hypothetical protein
MAAVAREFFVSEQRLRARLSKQDRIPANQKLLEYQELVVCSGVESHCWWIT